MICEFFFMNISKFMSCNLKHFRRLSSIDRTTQPTNYHLNLKQTFEVKRDAGKEVTSSNIALKRATFYL